MLVLFIENGNDNTSNIMQHDTTNSEENEVASTGNGIVFTSVEIHSNTPEEHQIMSIENQEPSQENITCDLVDDTDSLTSISTMKVDISENAQEIFKHAQDLSKNAQEITILRTDMGKVLEGISKIERMQDELKTNLLSLQQEVCNNTREVMRTKNRLNRIYGRDRFVQ